MPPTLAYVHSIKQLNMGSVLETQFDLRNLYGVNTVYSGYVTQLLKPSI